MVGYAPRVARKGRKLWVTAVTAASRLGEREAVYPGRRRGQDVIWGRRVIRLLPGYTAVGLSRCGGWMPLSELISPARWARGAQWSGAGVGGVAGRVGEGAPSGPERVVWGWPGLLRGRRRAVRAWAFRAERGACLTGVEGRVGGLHGGWVSWCHRDRARGSAALCGRFPPGSPAHCRSAGRASRWLGPALRWRRLRPGRSGRPGPRVGGPRPAAPVPVRGVPCARGWRAGRSA